MPHICMDEINLFIAALKDVPALFMLLRFKVGI